MAFAWGHEVTESWFLGVKHLKSILKTKVVQRGENLENSLGESASRGVYMFTSPGATLSVADT